MKGINSEKNRLRHKVFTEVARFAYEGGGPEQLDELPYKMVNMEGDPYRPSMFLERAIIGERIRVAMGNAINELKKESDFITDSNDNDGISNFFENNIF